MDVLFQVLSSVRVNAAIFFAAEFTAPWVVASARSETIAALLPGASEPFVAYHLLTEGRAWARIDGEECIALAPGDLLVLPHEDAHVLSSQPIDRHRAEQMLDVALPAMGTEAPPFVRGGGGGAVTRFVCGYLACDQDAGQLLRRGLPSLIRIQLRTDSAGQWLEDSIRHLASDYTWLSPARSVLVTRMADALLVETLRRYASQLPPEDSSWLDGARDPVVGAVIALFQRRPSHPGPSPSSPPRPRSRARCCRSASHDGWVSRRSGTCAAGVCSSPPGCSRRRGRASSSWPPASVTHPRPPSIARSSASSACRQLNTDGPKACTAAIRVPFRSARRPSSCRRSSGGQGSCSRGRSTTAPKRPRSWRRAPSCLASWRRSAATATWCATGEAD